MMKRLDYPRAPEPRVAVEHDDDDPIDVRAYDERVRVLRAAASAPKIPTPAPPTSTPTRDDGDVDADPIDQANLTTA